MKKTLTILLLNFSFLGFFGQLNSPKVKFKCTYLSFLKAKTELIEIHVRADSILGLDFYKDHFNLSSQLPNKLTNGNYKNQTIVIWKDTTRVKDFYSNWSYSYTYDSLSRLTEYNYSGCIICGQMPFQIKIEYDDHNRPLSFQKRHSLLDQKDSADEEYVVSYDEKGSIKQIKIFSFGIIFNQVERI